VGIFKSENVPPQAGNPGRLACRRQRWGGGGAAEGFPFSKALALAVFF